MTTYDEVYTLFMSMTRVDEYSLPSTNDGIYQLIDTARVMFNQKTGLSVVQDDIMEQFNILMNGNQKLLFARCLRLVTFSNMLSEFASMVSMSTKDTAIKDYKSQSTIRRQLVVDEEKAINNLVFYMLEIEEV